MKKYLLALLLFALPAGAQISNPPHFIIMSVVAKLPAAASAPNQMWAVTDGTSSTDCTTGGGSTAVICQSNGTTWVAITGGGGTWPGYPAAGVVVSTGSAWGTSLTAPSGALVGTTDTQTLTNKTIDGVSPTTMGYVDPTSSVQTQLNAKAPLASPALTGTPTAPTQSCASNTDIATGAYVANCAGSSTLPSGVNGQTLTNTGGGATTYSAQSPSISLMNGGSAITPPYSVLCDSATVATGIQDRSKIGDVTATGTVTLPDLSGTGCSGMYGQIENGYTAAITISRQTSDTLNCWTPGSAPTTGQTTCSVPAGSWAFFSPASTTTYDVKIVPVAGGSGGTFYPETSQTTGFTAAFASTPNFYPIACASSCTVTLPSSAPSSGYYDKFANNGPATVWVYPNGLTLDSVAYVQPLKSGQSITIVSTGSNYVSGRVSNEVGAFGLLYRKQFALTIDGNASSNITPINELSGTMAGTATLVSATSTTPDYLSLASAATSGAVTGAYSNKNGMHYIGHNIVFEAESAIVSFASGSLRFCGGIWGGGDPTGTSGCAVTQSAGFRYDTGTSDTNFMCYAAGASVGTSGNGGLVSSGVAADANFHKFKIVMDDTGGRYLYFIDGSLVCTITSNLPTGSAARTFWTLTNLTTTAETFGFAGVVGSEDQP